MKLRNKRNGKVYTAFRLCFYEPMDDVEKLNWKTLKEFCEDWEDYEPKEPLIKDEKIRKAVMAWANTQNSRSVVYAERKDRSLCNLVDYDGEGSISFTGWIPTLKDSEVYTIDELCGNEK